MSAPSLEKILPEEQQISNEQNEPIAPRRGKRRWPTLVFRLACTIALFVLLLNSISWPELLQNIYHLDDSVLLIAVTIGFLGVVISAYQWQVLLDGEHIRLDLRRLVNFYLMGIAFSHFLPTGMGGDVVKIYYVGREGNNFAGSASAALMSRVMGYIGMLLVSLPVLFIWQKMFNHELTLTYILSSMLVCAGLVVSAGVVVMLPRIVQGRWAKWRIFAVLNKVGNTLLASIRRPSFMAGSILYGMVFHFSAALNYYAFGMALHMQVPFAFYLVAIPFVSLVAFLPCSINGFGLRESALVSIFATMHVPNATAMTLGLLVDVQMLFFGIIGGVLYLAMERAKAKQGICRYHDGEIENG
jgi:glycosyltransferase 2 family protein